MRKQLLLLAYSHDSPVEIYQPRIENAGQRLGIFFLFFFFRPRAPLLKNSPLLDAFFLCIFILDNQTDNKANRQTNTQAAEAKKTTGRQKKKQADRQTQAKNV